MDTKTQLRDKVVNQLLGILMPFQVVALDVGDIGSDDGALFLRVCCREDAANEHHKFVSLPAQIRADLEAFLVDGLPLYERRSEALFPNRFGGRLTTRSLRMRYQREYGIKRNIMEVGKPVGIEGIRWFNLWNRAEVIYFAQAEGELIKIGHSRCFSTRFQTLESEEGQMKLLGLVEGSKYDEARILNRFRHLLVRGREWFEPAEELLNFIDAANREGMGAFDGFNQGADIKIRCDSCGNLRHGVSTIPLYGEVRVCGECRGELG